MPFITHTMASWVSCHLWFQAGVAAGAEVLTSDVTTMTEVTALTSARSGNNGLKVGCGCEAETCSGTHEASVGRPLFLSLLNLF